MIPHLGRVRGFSCEDRYLRCIKQGSKEHRSVSYSHPPFDLCNWRNFYVGVFPKRRP